MIPYWKVQIQNFHWYLIFENRSFTPNKTLQWTHNCYENVERAWFENRMQFGLKQSTGFKLKFVSALDKTGKKWTKEVYFYDLFWLSYRKIWLWEFGTPLFHPMENPFRCLFLLWIFSSTISVQVYQFVWYDQNAWRFLFFFLGFLNQ